MKAATILFAPLWRILNTIADRRIYLQAIAVDKEIRGEGVGSILVDSTEDGARALGATRFSLEVSAIETSLQGNRTAPGLSATELFDAQQAMMVATLAAGAGG